MRWGHHRGEGAPPGEITVGPLWLVLEGIKDRSISGKPDGEWVRFLQTRVVFRRAGRDGGDRG